MVWLRRESEAEQKRRTKVVTTAAFQAALVSILLQFSLRGLLAWAFVSVSNPGSGVDPAKEPVVVTSGWVLFFGFTAIMVYVVARRVKTAAAYGQKVDWWDAFWKPLLIWSAVFLACWWFVFGNAWSAVSG